MTPQNLHGSAPLNVAVIIGSTREGRLAPHVAICCTARRPPETPPYETNATGLSTQPRQAFIELHAAPIRDTVSFHGVWPLFDADGS